MKILEPMKSHTNNQPSASQSRYKKNDIALHGGSDLLDNEKGVGDDPLAPPSRIRADEESGISGDRMGGRLGQQAE